MDYKEAVELCVDIFTEFMPKMPKSLKEDTAAALVQELQDAGVLTLYSEDDSYGAGGDEDLTNLFDRYEQSSKDD